MPKSLNANFSRICAELVCSILLCLVLPLLPLKHCCVYVCVKERRASIWSRRGVHEWSMVRSHEKCTCSNVLNTSECWSLNRWSLILGSSANSTLSLNWLGSRGITKENEREQDPQSPKKYYYSVTVGNHYGPLLEPLLWKSGVVLSITTKDFIDLPMIKYVGVVSCTLINTELAILHIMKINVVKKYQHLKYFSNTCHHYIWIHISVTQSIKAQFREWAWNGTKNMGKTKMEDRYRQ